MHNFVLPITFGNVLTTLAILWSLISTILYMQEKNLSLQNENKLAKELEKFGDRCDNIEKVQIKASMENLKKLTEELAKVDKRCDNIEKDQLKFNGDLRERVAILETKNSVQEIFTEIKIMKTELDETYTLLVENITSDQKEIIVK